MKFISLACRVIGLAFIFLLPNYTWAESAKSTPLVSLENLPKGSYFAHVGTQYLAKIIDKTGNIFFLQEADYLDQGYGNIDIYIAQNKNQTKEQRIYTSTFEPESGGCYTGQRTHILTERKIDPNKINYSFMGKQVFKTTRSFDRSEGVALLIREQDCNTHQINTIGFIISPQTEGVKVVPITTEK